VLAHVHAARALAPPLAARGRGHLLLTASAAGLLTNMDSAPYSVTKHGTVTLAQWLAIRWGDAILPHPEVAEFERRRAADRDRWLVGMRRARARL
jgi:NAD(P)-dependent dehydrogenase (short-subunit alcohol dehydrogenase family)